MLCFLQTDAALTPHGADALLGAAVRRSFDRISVDGQLSTNDTVVLMASGQSGVHVEPDSEDEAMFAQALDALTLALALRIVADGEGARRIARVHVRGAGEETVSRVARAIANSPLVKAALFGGDPNWGASRRRSGRRCRGPRRCASTSRSRASPLPATAPASSTTPPRWRAPSAAMRCSMRLGCLAKGRRPSCSSPISATTT